MGTNKLTLSVWLGLTLTFFSCQEDTIEPVKDNGSVAFAISTGQVPDSHINNGGRTEDMITVPEGMCNMDHAAFAVAVVDDERYQLDIQLWGESFKTNLLELDPGIHVLSEFIVHDEGGGPLFATPTLDSEFEKFVDFALPIGFEIQAYEKIENPVDVLCIEEFTPPLFGFKFWNIDLKSIKTLCVFANYCDPDEGHMVASITAQVFPNPNQTSAKDLIWEGAVGGAGELLCIKLPYDPDISLEEQTYYVVLFVNGVPYAGVIDLMFVEEISVSEDRYLHLNHNCEGDFGPFVPLR